MTRLVLVETTIRVRAVFRVEDAPRPHRRVTLAPPLPVRESRLRAH